MKVWKMFTQCIPWPGNFSTYITCMGDPGNMVSFNVLLHILVRRLLSTDITRGHLSLSCRKRYFTSCDHWHYLFIQILQLHIDFVIPNGNCCVRGYLWRLIKGWLWFCEFSTVLFLHWDSSVLCKILVWVSFSISTTSSKAFQSQFFSEGKEGIKIFLKDICLPTVEKVHDGHKVIWSQAPHVYERVGVLGLLQKLHEERAWRGQDHFVGFNLLAIFTGKSDISEFYVFPETSKWGCDVFFEVVPLETEFFCGSHYWTEDILSAGNKTTSSPILTCTTWVALSCPKLHWSYCSVFEQLLWPCGVGWVKSSRTWCLADLYRL